MGNSNSQANKHRKSQKWIIAMWIIIPLLVVFLWAAFCFGLIMLDFK